MKDVEIKIENFLILTTGTDGGHTYIIADISYQGDERKLAVFFADKADERRIKAGQVLTVTRKLMDEGIQHSLHLLEAKIIGID